jgi:hypothetical protein
LDERRDSTVSAALRHRVRQSASGVLDIDGDPSGAVYLDRGIITFAGASWCADIDARLRGILGSREPGARSPALALGGRALGGRALGGRALGAALMERGYLTEEGLRDVMRSAIIDAVTVLALPLREESLVSGIRFGGPRRHWADGLCRVDLDDIWAEAVHRARRLASAGITLTRPVALCDLRGSSAVVRRDQWLLACKAGSGVPVRDLARDCGMELCDAAQTVSELVRAGLCVTAPAAADAAGGGTAGAAEPGSAESPDVLRRVLDGLRRLG